MLLPGMEAGRPDDVAEMIVRFPATCACRAKWPAGNRSRAKVEGRCVHGCVDVLGNWEITVLGEADRVAAAAGQTSQRMRYAELLAPARFAKVNSTCAERAFYARRQRSAARGRLRHYAARKLPLASFVTAAMSLANCLPSCTRSWQEVEQWQNPGRRCVWAMI